jgi:hypothetical protein
MCILLQFEKERKERRKGGKKEKRALLFKSGSATD